MAKPLEEALRRKFKRALKKISLRILQRIAPDTLITPEQTRTLKALSNRSLGSIDAALSPKTTTTAASHSSAILAGATQTAQVSDLLSQPLILNSNDDLINTEVINLLLKSIFSSDMPTDTLRAYLLDTLTSADSLDSAEQAIEAWIMAEIAHNNMAAASFAQQFFAHRVDVQKNRVAYSNKGKPRPDAVFWPDPSPNGNGRSLFETLPYVNQVPLIDKSTPIASAGSCFAMEIAHVLQQQGFNYLVKEPNTGDDYTLKNPNDRLPIASAAWGIIFNNPCFLQLVEKAFGLRRMPKILWSYPHEGKPVYCDPFREEIIFPSPEAFERNYEVHISKAREVFLEAKVLVITLGLNEVWTFKADGSAFARSPWKIAPSLVQHHTLSVEQNVACLQKMLDILRHYNPSIQLIITLSPVPLHATFMANTQHIVEANLQSKSVLKVAAQVFVERNRGVYYFPSFETVTYCTPNPWDSDQRHVSRDTVRRVMTLFNEMFVKPS